MKKRTEKNRNNFKITIKIKEIIKKIKFKKGQRDYLKILEENTFNGLFTNSNMVSDDQFSEQRELDKRNNLYSNLLFAYVEQYTSNQKKKNKNKWRFYLLIVIAFVILLLFMIVVPIVITFVLDFSQEKNKLLLTYLASFISIFSTLITMPRAIAKYLFNPKEDEIISNLVTNMQKHDNETKELMIKKENTKNGK